MGIWDSYFARVGGLGQTRREVSKNRLQRNIRDKAMHSLSYHTIAINDVGQSLTILNTADLNTKTLCTMPGEDFDNGTYVDWRDTKWLITERDPSDEVYTKGTMEQCNYILRWINVDGDIVERWCIIKDGSNYMVGESPSKESIFLSGDTRVSLTIARDEETARLGRHNRFIIDDPSSLKPLSYRLTKPFKMGEVYEGHGIMSFFMKECDTEDSDNFDYNIANYYDYFDENGVRIKHVAEDLSDEDNVEDGADDEKKEWF